jgi:hypothetical protein
MAKNLELHLQRAASLPDRTRGTLTDNGAHQCYSCEDPVRPAGVKVPGATAIPAGRYRVILSESRRFRRELPELLNVPGFAGIRIHGGNGPDDTEGCILVGRMANTSKIWDCAPALQALIDKMRLITDDGGKVYITIS